MSINLQQFGFNKGYKLNSVQEDVVNKINYSISIYQQSGAELFTAFGKTITSAAIAAMYSYNKPNCKVLVLSNGSGTKNNKSQMQLMLNKKIYSKFQFINYEALRIADDPVIQFDLKNIGVIIIDECHLALGAKTYVALGKVLNKFPNAARVALTATRVRASDDRDSIATLVPFAYAHGAVFTYNLNDASRSRIINNINYVVVKNNFSDVDLRSLKRFKDVANEFSDTRKAYNSLVSKIGKYNKSKASKIKAALGDYIGKSKRKPNDISGERHIAFFAKIDDVEEQSEYLREAMQKLYPGFSVNVHKFTTNTNDKDSINILQNHVNSPVPDKTIDIITTVDRGSTSIHPQGIKSIMMFRGTQSNTVFIQQIGRGVSLRMFNAGEIYVFDFCDNIKFLDRITIGRGKYAVGQRTKDIQNLVRKDTLSEIRKEIISKTSGSLTVTNVMSTSTLMKYLDEYTEIITLCKSRQVLVDLMALKGKYGNDKNIREYPSVLRLIKKHKSDKYSLNLLSTYQDIDIFSDKIGRLLVNRALTEDSIVPLSSALSLGHTLFLTNKVNIDSENQMKAMDRIKAELNAGASYSTLSKGAKADYNKLISSKASNSILSTTSAYADYIGLDLSVSASNKSITSQFKSGLTNTEYDTLEKIVNGLKGLEKLKPENQLAKWNTIKALIYISERMFSYNMAKALELIKGQFRAEYIKFNPTIDKSIDFNFFVGLCENIKKPNVTIVGLHEINVCKHSCDLDNYSPIEKEIARLMGLDRDKFNTVFKKTKWFKSLVSAYKSGNKAEYDRLINEAANSNIPFRNECALKYKNNPPV